MTDPLEPHLVNRSWLSEPALRRLMLALNTDGEELRIVGGAVRNALLGEPIGDIDCATTALPEKVTAMAKAAGFKVVPTGIEHGTVTVVVDGLSFEVTTLRVDVASDGRHARVVFGRDWTRDAERRDFTMNALSIDAQGMIHDPINGYHDLVHRHVRFIGDAERRIREDYLRSLRFFRFFAYYGAGRPDGEGLRAVARTKAGLLELSAERVWSEFRKTLAADNPERAILWMRTSEVLKIVLPENWGLDQFHWLLAAERDQGWKGDPLRRLQAMLRPDETVVRALADRLKFSNAERRRLGAWARFSALAQGWGGLPLADFAKALYRQEDPMTVCDVLAHEFAKQRVKGEESAEHVKRLHDFARDYEKPVFPVSGQDMRDKGVEAGPALGMRLKALEDLWVESGFTLTRAQLLAKD